MTTSDYERSSRGGIWWLLAPIVVLLFLGGMLSFGAYFYADVGLTVMEAITAGFAALAAIIIGLFAALIGVVVGLVGAAFGIAVGGGAAVLALFIVASPVIAIILLILLLNSRKQNCPSPGAID